ncbi:MAG: hypothetical protein K9G45_06330 [Bacteroidales bacterium]|nr:hypothetical protein [Bacteroidales bacterium]
MLPCISYIPGISQTDGRSAGLAGATVALQDAWSVHHNQAGMTATEKLCFGAAYENRFLVEELGFKSFAVIIPAKPGTFGISLSQFGYSIFRESKVGIAYAKKLWSNISLGIQLDYLNISLGGEYGSKDVYTFEIGMQAEISEKIRIGAHVFNPVRARLSDFQDERIELIYQTGLVYSFSDELIASVEAEKYIDHPLNLKTGLEYNFKEKFYLRGGIATKPASWAMGFGMKLQNFSINLASLCHQVLGFSPTVSVQYAF